MERKTRDKKEGGKCKQNRKVEERKGKSAKKQKKSKKARKIQRIKRKKTSRETEKIWKIIEKSERKTQFTSKHEIKKEENIKSAKVETKLKRDEDKGKQKKI